MSLAAADLDVLRDLAAALGLVDASGSFREAWLSDPGRPLSEVLADAHQRESLVAFLDEVLGGEESTIGPDGSTWLPIVERNAPDLRLYLVLDDRAASSVAIGVGVRYSTTGPRSSTTAHVPLFRVAKKGQSVPSPLLLGTADAVVTLTTEITVDPAAPLPGQAHLGGLSLLVSVPTGGGAPPRLALRLQQLQLPGATGPRDLSIDAANPAELDATVIDLVLGLVRAQAAALPPGDLTALAGLLGLRDGVGVPPLPVQDLAAGGVGALASWLESVVTAPASRAAWVSQVAALVGGTAVGDEVQLHIGTAVVTLGVRTAAGSDGHARLTPTLAARIDVSPSAVVRAEAVLLTIDLGSGAATALPRLGLELVLGRRPEGGAVLLDEAGPPAVRVEAVRAGLALDAARRPTLVLAADRVTIGSHTHETLDLSSPDAVADAGGVVLSDVADEVLNRLGPAADAVRVLLGLAAPAGHPGVPTLDLGEFFQDPLRAVGEHWRTVVRDHAAAVPAVITTLRDLVADAAEATGVVAGSGTEADPWRVRIAGPVELQAWASGERLSLAPALTLVVDTLGERCTSVETRLRVVAVEIDLAERRVAFLPAVEAGIALRARTTPQLAIVGSAFVLTADAIELRARWTPTGGLHAGFSAPNLALDLGQGPLPVPIPTIEADGHVSLDADGWNAVEGLLAAFAQAAGPAWLSELVGTLGWVRRDPFALAPVRLRLADLVDDPAAALEGWLGGLAVRDPDLVVQGLSLLSRVVGGTKEGIAGVVEGSGRRHDPWLVPLSRTAGAPQLAAWVEPDGPAVLVAGVPTPLQTWHPGLPGLSSGALAAALRDEAVVADDVAALLSGRPDVAAGLEALVLRWTGTDGRVVAPDADPAGITVERRVDVTSRDLPAFVDVEELLGRTPATVVRVAVSAPDALPWPGVPPDGVVDLTTPGLAPAAFTPPSARPGEWYVALGGRAAARLATGDPDGVLGQVERLRRFLEALAGVPGGLVVVAEAAAGQAARGAAELVAAVTDLVLLGTPLGPVSYSVLDANPAADALRLLARLLPSATDELSDDPDLSLGRGLVVALASLLPLEDPALELRVPTPPPAAPRAGLAVHAVFGVVGEDAVRRGLTAVVAAGLAERAVARAARPAAEPNAARLALRVPIPRGAPSVGDVVLDGYVQLDLAGLGVDEAGAHAQTDRSVVIHAGVGRLDAWLVGGPDPGRAPGARPEPELRRVSFDVTLPAGEGAPEARAVLTLHEPRAFGVVRERWVVQPAGEAAPPGVDAATPALPEVRVLLSGLAEALGAAAAGPAAAFAVALEALGLLDPAGGSVPDAVDHLLHDAAAHLRAVVEDVTQRQKLVTALRSLFPGGGATPDDLVLTLGPATVAVDLAARRVTVDATATPDAFGLFPWSGRFVLEGTTSASGELAIGGAGTTVAGGAELRLAAAPLAVALRWHRPGLAEEIPLWPQPDADALARALARLVLAELARTAFEVARDLDASVRPVVDAALGALGFLGPVAADGSRRVLLPAALLTDPAAWLVHEGVLGVAGGFDAARLIALLDAFKPLVGVGGGPGEWALTPGVVAKAEAGNGAPRLSLVLDSSRFAPIPGVAGRLTVGGAMSLALPASGLPRPGVEVSVGLAGAAAGREAVHVVFGDQVAVFLRPALGADLPLYPTAAGLGQLAETLVTQALPLVLDRLAARASDPGILGQVGTLVRTLGDALALRSGAAFDGAALRSWAADPVKALSARLPALSAAVLGEIADAVQPLLPGGAGASVVASALQVEVGDVTVVLQPAPFSVAVRGEVVGLRALERISFGVALAGSGLEALHVEVGPADIDAGGVSLRPFAGFHAGRAPAGGRRAEIALGLGGDRRVGGRWLLGDRFDLVVVGGGVERAEAELVAVALLEATLDIVASFALATQAVSDALAKTVGGSTVRDVLRGVLLNDANPSDLDDDLFAPDRLLGRLQRLGVNLGDAAPSVVLDGGFGIGLAADDRGGGRKAVGLRLSITKPVILVQGDLTISLETDARWIRAPGGPLPDGIVIDALRTGPGADEVAFEPGLSANGVGLRFGKESGPILDVGGVSLGSVALHLFGQVGSMPLAGGVELQLADLAVGVSGARGGNPVAQGIMCDAGQGGSRLAPRFSPALAVQKHGGGPVLVSLRAGEGTGPWWLALQKGFGPLYIEQVGFGVTVRQDQLERISLLLDGRVSLLGLTAAVDDLQLTFVVASDASVFDPSRWAVDLAGLAISSDIGGITLQGGLRKFGSGDTVQYVGMLLGRFGVYGLSVFGGYGQGVQDGQRFASFFAFGAVNGPIGGPPAFFVTGIGGGLGINRQLVVPTDLSHFDEYPFIKALDPAAQPSPDPMAELTALSTTFPMERGSFWFAAGLSFNSFALVDGVAVVSVQVGDGLQIALLGLARMALPRPEVALVSIEMGLVARFSSKEGVLWVQAQLTDNSWLLYPDVRLTGGFAFVTWFAGPHRGEFVLTIGGYHPRFHRDGYPEVPRLGLQWRVTPFIAAKGEAYFALTSEALMAGGRLEIAAEVGPGWAHIVFGADGIVYFDPFRFEVEAYARISAGVTIDVWIGEITISISIGASILVQGPRFYGKAKFSVGPVDLSVPFGDRNQTPKQYLPWAEFVRKYLEEASPGVARVVTAIPGKGALPPGTGPGGATDTGTADGSAARPFTVYAEFEMMVTTAVPSRTIDLGGAPLTAAPSRVLGLAPMGISDAASTLHLNLVGPGGDFTARLGSELHRGPGFPVGVWGLPQADDDRKVPAGAVIDAIDGIRLFTVATIPPGLPPIDYRNRVDIGERLPLPFVNETGARPGFIDEAGDVAALLPPGATDAEVYAEGARWMARAGHGRTARAAIRGDRAAPPRFGSLTDGLAAATAPAVSVTLPDPTPPPVVDAGVHPPVAAAVLTSPLRAAERPPVRTTVNAVPGGIVVTPPPTLETVVAALELAVPAQLHRLGGTTAPLVRDTVVAAGAGPLTRLARGGLAAVGGRGAVGDGRDRLADITAGLGGAGPERTRARAAFGFAGVAAGEIAVLRLPNAQRDVDEDAGRPGLGIDGGPARVVALRHGGEVLADVIVEPDASRVHGFAVPRGTERLAVGVAGDVFAGASGLSGWHAATALAYVGWSSALGAGAVVRAEGGTVSSTRHRRTAGWVRGAELVAGTSIVVTRFVGSPTVVVVALDDPVGTDAARGLSLGLTGADRRLGADGSLRPPLVVVRANRTFLVYDVSPRDGEPVVVTVASQDGWHLAGVMGGTGSPAPVAELLATRGIDTVVRPVLPGAGGSRTFSWIDVPSTPTPTPAAKRATDRPGSAAPRAKVARKTAAPKKAGTGRKPTRGRGGR